MSLTSIIQKVSNQYTKGSDYLNNLTAKYLVKPKGLHHIGGFIFDYEHDTDVRLNANITDHYVEDNTTIQDHIALPPIRITLRGFISELAQNNQPPSGYTNFIQAITNKLTTVPAYLGDFSAQAIAKQQKVLTDAQALVNSVDYTVSRINNIAGLFSNAAPGQTKQAQAYQKMESLWDKKVLFSVETPYKIYDNMAIEILSFVQNETTKMMSDISITLKQIRFASVEFTKFNEVLYAGRRAQQIQPVADKGKKAGIAVDNADVGFIDVFLENTPEQ
jgi:hypothetical protein